MKTLAFVTFCLITTLGTLSVRASTPVKIWTGPSQPRMQQLVDDLIAYNETKTTGCASIAFPGLPHKGIFMQHAQFDALLNSKESECPAWKQYLEKDRDSLNQINTMDFYAFVILNYPASKHVTVTAARFKDPLMRISDQNAGWTFTSDKDPVTVILTN